VTGWERGVSGEVIQRFLGCTAAWVSQFGNSRTVWMGHRKEIVRRCQAAGTLASCVRR